MSDAGRPAPAVLDRMEADLSSAVVSDALDRIGLRHQVMDAAVRPMVPGTRPFAGIAATLSFGPVFDVPAEPYENQIAAIDALAPDSAVVLATGGLEGCAFWGELFSNAAIGRGARGVVMDGYHRDSAKIAEVGFPVFSMGSLPIDIAGRARVIDSACPVECGGVRVEVGDVVFADVDGVVVIPAGVVERVLQTAFEKAGSETSAREDLRRGMLLSEIWERHRVL
jgi:4-hydroxy-4-methyl-2-oxoglutarate aldolase